MTVAQGLFPGEDDAVHMIFGGSPVRLSRRREKIIWREVMHADVATPSYLKWSEVPITFDHKDHPDKVPQPRSYQLVVAPLFKSRRIHKVLMDGGSGINVLYSSTIDEMSIPRSATSDPLSSSRHTMCPYMARQLSGFSTAGSKFLSIVRRARMVSAGDNRIYTGSGLRGVIPYIQ
jgi:hypothetical protein